jgi:hypothetical protein
VTGVAKADVGHCCGLGPNARRRRCCRGPTLESDPAEAPERGHAPSGVCCEPVCARGVRRTRASCVNIAHSASLSLSLLMSSMASVCVAGGCGDLKAWRAEAEPYRDAAGVVGSRGCWGGKVQRGGGGGESEGGGEGEGGDER